MNIAEHIHERRDSLLIQFRNNDTGHDDVQVSMGGYSRTADSYYLALDRSVLAGDESADKVRQVLIGLLEHWIEALAHAAPTRPVYLPFDFSDQYTGCFQCKPDGEFIEIVPGWSNREGWSVCPSDPGDYFLGITDFKHDAREPIRLPRDEFFRRIRQSIADTKLQVASAQDSSA